MEKIGFVVHQYGIEVNGGAETHCRVVAENLLPYYESEVLTSTSVKYPYENYFSAGVDELHGVRVRRFEVKRRPSKEKLAEYNKRMLEGDEEGERAWMEETGPYCPDFVEYLKDHHSEYKVIIFFTYAHYLTYAGLSLGLPNTIMVPLAHDENNIYRPVYQKVFSRAKSFLFNTPEERDFVYKMFGKTAAPNRVTCIGINTDADKEEELPDKYRGIGDYIVYVGRITYSKNFEELNRYFIKYKETHKTDLKLICIGKIREDYPIRYHEDIIYPGFVTEEEKRALIQHARFMVLQSKTESLSYVILESFMFCRPVLVNAYSPVLVGQCERSNAGLYYSDYAEFEAMTDYLLTHEREARIMGENGRKFVLDNYDWDVVVRNIRSLIEEMG